MDGIVVLGNNEKAIDKGLFAIHISNQSARDHFENHICGNNEFNMEDTIECIEAVERQSKILLGILHRMREENEN